MTNGPLDISVDFDGVLCEDAYPFIGDMMPDADFAMRRIREAGHRIVINTCRTGRDADRARAWLAAHDIRYDQFNANFPDRIKQYGSDCRKISADVYIDDRNLGGFPGWIAALATLGIIETHEEEEQE